MHDAHPYAGKLVYLDKRPGDNFAPAPVKSVDSGSITSLGVSADDLAQDGSILYRLSGTTVYATVDLVNWNVEATAPLRRHVGGDPVPLEGARVESPR